MIMLKTNIIIIVEHKSRVVTRSPARMEVSFAGWPPVSQVQKSSRMF